MQYQKSLKLIRDNTDKLTAVANALMEREKLSGEEFEVVFSGGSLEPLADFKSESKIIETKEI